VRLEEGGVRSLVDQAASSRRPGSREAKLALRKFAP
jgi:hypothetical protein